MLEYGIINKVIYKQIEYKAKYQSVYEIVLWNNKYSIVGTHTAYVIIDIEEGKIIKINEVSNISIEGIKKIKLNNLGEYLITSGYEIFHYFIYNIIPKYY